MTQVLAMSNPKGNPATLKHYTPKWKSGETRTIRVPVVLADQVLEYAHKLDNNSLTQVNDDGHNGSDSKLAANQEKTLIQVIKALEEVSRTPNTAKFTKKLKHKLERKAIAPLKALTQVN